MSEQTPSELCPWCRSSRLRVGAVYVQCADCGAIGPQGKSTFDSLERWNTRAPSPDTVRLEKLAAEMEPGSSLADTMDWYFPDYWIMSKVGGCTLADLRTALDSLQTTDKLD